MNQFEINIMNCILGVPTTNEIEMRMVDAVENDAMVVLVQNVSKKFLPIFG